MTNVLDAGRTRATILVMESEMHRPAPAGEWRRGWPVVAAAMIGIGTGPGLFQNLSSLFIGGPVAEFGWSRGDIATAAGLGLLGGLAVPFLGRLADRIGAKAIIVLAMLLLGLTYAGMASLGGPLWQYQTLIFGLALTVPGTSAIVYGKLIAQRFDRAAASRWASPPRASRCPRSRLRRCSAG